MPGYDYTLFFDMHTYNAYMRSEMVSLVSLSLAIISFSDKFKNRTSIILTGSLMLILTIIGTMFQVTHYWNFITEVPDKDIPPHIPRRSLIVTQIIRFMYVLMVVFVMVEILTSQIWHLN